MSDKNKFRTLLVVSTLLCTLTYLWGKWDSGRVSSIGSFPQRRDRVQKEPDVVEFVIDQPNPDPKGDRIVKTYRVYHQSDNLPTRPDVSIPLVPKPPSPPHIITVEWKDGRRDTFFGTP